MTVLLSAAVLLLAYLVGAIPTGLIVGRRYSNIDIREHGSRNIGATNVWRTLGWKPGLTTFLIDAGKAFLVVSLVTPLTGGIGGYLPVLAGLAVLMGNFFNPFLGFKGGKGVAASLGVFLALAPLAILCAFLVFGVALAVAGYISLGSLLAAVALPILTAYFYGVDLLFFLTLVIALVVIVKHRNNVGRLLAGTESKFRFQSAGTQ